MVNSTRFQTHFCLSELIILLDFIKLEFDIIRILAWLSILVFKDSGLEEFL